MNGIYVCERIWVKGSGEWEAGGHGVGMFIYMVNSSGIRRIYTFI